MHTCMLNKESRADSILTVDIFFFFFLLFVFYILQSVPARSGNRGPIWTVGSAYCDRIPVAYQKQTRPTTATLCSPITTPTTLTANPNNTLHLLLPLPLIPFPIPGDLFFLVCTSPSISFVDTLGALEMDDGLSNVGEDNHIDLVCCIWSMLLGLTMNVEEFGIELTIP